MFKNVLWTLVKTTFNPCFTAEIIRKKRIYPCELQFYYIYVGFKVALIKNRQILVNNINTDQVIK